MPSGGYRFDLPWAENVNIAFSTDETVVGQLTLSIFPPNGAAVVRQIGDSGGCVVINLEAKYLTVTGTGNFLLIIDNEAIPAIIPLGTTIQATPVAITPTKVTYAAATGALTGPTAVGTVAIARINTNVNFSFGGSNKGLRLISVIVSLHAFPASTGNYRVRLVRAVFNGGGTSNMPGTPMDLNDPPSDYSLMWGGLAVGTNPTVICERELDPAVSASYEFIVTASDAKTPQIPPHAQLSNWQEFEVWIIVDSALNNAPLISVEAVWEEA